MPAGQAREEVSGQQRAVAERFVELRDEFGRELGGVVEVGIEPHGDVVGWRDRPRHVEFFLVYDKLEGAGETGFERGQAHFAIALNGMPVAGLFANAG